jgi:hypothetical protein
LAGFTATKGDGTLPADFEVAAEARRVLTSTDIDDIDD